MARRPPSSKKSSSVNYSTTLASLHRPMKRLARVEARKIVLRGATGAGAGHGQLFVKQCVRSLAAVSTTGNTTHGPSAALGRIDRGCPLGSRRSSRSLPQARLLGYSAAYSGRAPYALVQTGVRGRPKALGGNRENAKAVDRFWGSVREQDGVETVLYQSILIRAPIQYHRIGKTSASG